MIILNHEVVTKAVNNVVNASKLNHLIANCWVFDDIEFRRISIDKKSGQLAEIIRPECDMNRTYQPCDLKQYELIWCVVIDKIQYYFLQRNGNIELLTLSKVAKLVRDLPETAEDFLVDFGGSALLPGYKA